MKCHGLRLLPWIAGVLALGAASPAAAQQPPWSPSPSPAAEPPPSEGGGVGLQLLAGLGIGGAVATTLAVTSPDGVSGDYIVGSALTLTPAAVGFAVCNLGRRRELSEPSCPRAIIASYVGSLVALPVLIVTIVASIDCCDTDTTDDDIVIWGATSVAWVGGMVAGATMFGRRPIPPRDLGLSHAPRPPTFASADDPRQPRWAGARSSGQLAFRLLSVEF